MEVLEQGKPVGAVLHVDGSFRDPGGSGRRILPGPGLVSGQHDRLVAGRQPGGQLAGHSAPVGSQDPHPRTLGHLGRPPGQDHAPIRLLGGIGLVRSQDFGPLEAGIGQRLPPDGGAGQRMVGTAGVGEAPPAVQLPEGQVQPTLAPEVLEGHEVARGCQQVPAVLQGLGQVAGGVQHIGRDDQVVAVIVEALGSGILLDVEHPVGDRRLCPSEASLGLCEEARGDVGVGVVEAPAGEFRQHRGGGRARARPDLDHSQPPGFGHLLQQCRHRVGQHLVGRPRCRRLQVQVGRSGLTAAEQQRQRVGFAFEYLGQGAGAAPEQADLGRAVLVSSRHLRRELLGVGGHLWRQGIGGSRLDGEGLAHGINHARSGQQLEESAEESAVLGQRPELPAQPVRLDQLAGSALPAETFKRLQRVAPRQSLQVRQQTGPAGPVHARGIEVSRERAGTTGYRGGTGKEIGRHHSRGQGPVPPHDLVHQVVQAVGRGEQRRPGGPLARVGVQAADLGAVDGVEPQVGCDDLTGPAGWGVCSARLAQAGAADQLVRERAPEPQSLPSERQVGSAVLGAGGSPGRGHHLEAAVQHEWVQRRVAAGAAGQGHFAHRLAVADPQRAQRAERFAEIDTRAGSGLVELRQIGAGEFGREPLQFEPLGARRRPGER